MSDGNSGGLPSDTHDDHDNGVDDMDSLLDFDYDPGAESRPKAGIQEATHFDQPSQQKDSLSPALYHARAQDNHDDRQPPFQQAGLADPAPHDLRAQEPYPFGPSAQEAGASTRPLQAAEQQRNGFTGQQAERIDIFTPQRTDRFRAKREELRRAMASRNAEVGVGWMDDNSTARNNQMNLERQPNNSTTRQQTYLSPPQPSQFNPAQMPYFGSPTVLPSPRLIVRNPAELIDAPVLQMNAPMPSRPTGSKRPQATAFGVSPGLNTSSTILCVGCATIRQAEEFSVKSDGDQKQWCNVCPSPVTNFMLLQCSKCTRRCPATNFQDLGDGKLGDVCRVCRGMSHGSRIVECDYCGLLNAAETMGRLHWMSAKSPLSQLCGECMNRPLFKCRSCKKWYDQKQHHAKKYYEKKGRRAKKVRSCQ